MASRANNFCIDAHDPYAQTMWWAQVLDDFRLPTTTDDENHPDDDECGLVGVDDRQLLFLRVPEAKTVKNRMHLCLRPTDRTRDEEVERILALGASMFDDRRDGDLGWAVLADPEGNEFCVLNRYRPPTRAEAPTDDPKWILVDYLQQARDSMLYKLDGLSDYDARRPLTTTGTNLLGLVKHLASVELGYFGDTFGRPSGIETPWLTADSEPNEDMYLAPDESREWVVDLYQRSWAHADGTFERLTLDSKGTVPWWPAERNAVTLQRILVHMVAETQRHAGHADIVRELIDGQAGRRPDDPNMAAITDFDWPAYVDRVEEAARAASSTPD